MFEYHDIATTMKPIAFIVFFIAALFVRTPDLLPPRFWAEDLNVFVAVYLADGVKSLIQPYAGYLHAVPRLTAGALWLVPLEWAAWWFLTVTIAITLWSASILARSAGNGIAGLLAGLSLIFAHGWIEPIGSVTNLQWIMAPALLAIVLNRKPFRPVESILFIFLAGLSGPFSVAFSPIFAAAFIVEFAKYKRMKTEALLGAVCGFVQLIVIFLNPSSQANELPRPIWLLTRLLELPFEQFFLPLLPAALLFITLFRGEKRLLRIGLFAGIMSLTVIVAYKFHHQPLIFESGNIGHRYWYVQSVLWILIAASAVGERTSWVRYASGVSVIILVSTSIVAQVNRPWPWKADNWSEFISRAKKGPSVYKYAPDWEISLDLTNKK